MAMSLSGTDQPLSNQMTTGPIHDTSKLNDILRQWKGAEAKIWEYHPSLGRLALQVYRPLENEQLYLVNVSCQTITGRFHWRNCDIQVIEERYESDEYEASHLVRDQSSGFSLRCNGVVLVCSTMAEFGLYKDMVF